MEPMQVDVIPEENDNMNFESHIVENPNIDLESLVLNFTGLTKMNRLQFIAEHCPPLRVEALKTALQTCMQTMNTIFYQQIIRHIELSAPHALPADNSWLELTTKKAALKLEKLDTDLKNYKSNSIKESIRRGLDDLGDHYLDCGDLNNALKCFSRARDYCTEPLHVIKMCMNVIKVSVYLQNWSHVLSYVNKAQSSCTNEIEESNLNYVTRLKCASGLAELCLGKYKSAAKSFLQASFDYSEMPDLISANNIAVYGVLTSLATFDRQELQRLVLSSASFKLFLELEPQLREVLYDFYNSKYAQCLSALDRMKDALLLDLYLARHVDTLYNEIRKRALKQYFKPYTSANMHKMAVAFNTTIYGLEDELMKLILDGQINARIDSQLKILYAKSIDERKTTFEKAIQVGKEYEWRMKSLLVRSAALRAGLQIKSGQVTRDCPLASEMHISSRH